MTFEFAKKVLKMSVAGLKSVAAQRKISVPGLLQDANKAVKKGLQKSKVSQGTFGKQEYGKAARRPQSLSGAERMEMTRAKAAIRKRKK